METLTYLLALPLVERLGWVLLHFLWQGALIGVLCAVVLRTRIGRQANLAYLVTVGALLLCGLMPLLTSSLVTISDIEPRQELDEVSASVAPERITSNLKADEETMAFGATAAVFVPEAKPYLGPIESGAEAELTAWESISADLQPFVRWSVLAWFPIACLMSFRLLWGWVQLQGCIRRSDTVRAGKWVVTMKELCQRVGLQAQVRLAESIEIAVPMVVGVVRPVILVPVGFLTGMDEAQVRAVLLHELAHVRRHDYFVNFLQAIVCSILFYHPVVWWLDRKARHLRECCCDQAAVSVIEDHSVYARALEGLASQKANANRLAPAGTDGSLLGRLRFLFGAGPVTVPSLRSIAGAGLFFFLAAALIGVMHFSSALEAEDLPRPLSSVEGFEGRVLNAGGAPAGGVEVALYHLKYYYGLDNGVIEATVTDAAGKFKFESQLSFYRQEKERTRDAYTVVAWDGVSGMAWHAVDKLKGIPEQLELRLEEARPRTIRVVDVEGIGIEGAEVYLHSIGDGRNTALFANGFAPIRQLTNSAGIALFEQMPTDNLNFAAAASGYSDSWTGCGAIDTDAEIVLHPEATVEGIVQDINGLPLVDVLVCATPEWALQDYVYTRTDARGHFRLSGLYGKGGAWTEDGGTGEYRVYLEHDVFQASAFKVELQQGEVSVNHLIEAQTGARVSGVLLDPVTEAVVPFAQISVKTEGGEYSLETDADGRFEFPSPPGEIRVGFWQPPSGTYVVTGSIDRGRPHWIDREVGRQDVELTLYAPSALGTFVQVSGRVLSPDGTPAAGAVLSAKLVKLRTSLNWEGNRMRGMRDVTTDSEGRFVFENYPRGYAFDGIVRHPKKPFARLVELPKVGEGGADLGDFQLEATFKRSVQIVDLEGNPVANKRISYGPFTGLEWHRTHSVPTVPRSRLYSELTDEDGQLVLGACLPDVPYDLWISDERDSWKRILPDQMSSDEPLQITLSTQLRVRIEDTEGKALSIVEASHSGFSEYDRANRWNPISIIKQLEEGRFLIEKESYRFHAGGSDIDMWCLLPDGNIVQARGQFPIRGSLLRLQITEPLIEKTKLTIPESLEPSESALTFYVTTPEGEPIEGVGVVADPLSSQGEPLKRITDAEGIAIFENANKRIIYCEFTKEGLAPQWQATVPLGEVIPVVMSSGVKIVGQFKDAEGTLNHGVVKLRIEASRRKLWPNGRDYAVDEIPYHVETDAEGRYDFRLLPGSYRLFAESEAGGFLVLDEWRVKLGEGFIGESLGAGVMTEIFFSDSQTGEPVAGVPVVVKEKIAPYHTGIRKGSKRISDADGRVHWKNLMPGSIRFDSYAMAPYSIDPQIPYSRWWSEDHAFDFGRLNAEKYNEQSPRGRDGVDDMVFELKGEDNRFAVTMERGVHVSGTVELPEVMPKGNVTVTLVPVSNQRTSLTGDSRDNIPVDLKDGSFSAWMPAGNGLRYRACAYFREYGIPKGAAHLPAALSEPFDSKPGDAFTFKLSMLGGGWLVGRVVDSTGEPVGGIGIQAIPLDNASGVDAEPVAVTDANGLYRIGPIRATEYEVLIDETTGVNVSAEVIAKVYVEVIEGEQVTVDNLIYPKSKTVEK